MPTIGRGPGPPARVLAAIDGAGLAHIAAHGTFRADSPMIVDDLERLRRAVSAHPAQLRVRAARPGQRR